MRKLAQNIRRSWWNQKGITGLETYQSAYFTG